MKRKNERIKEKWMNKKEWQNKGIAFICSDRLDHIKRKRISRGAAVNSIFTTNEIEAQVFDPHMTLLRPMAEISEESKDFHGKNIFLRRPPSWSLTLQSCCSTNIICHVTFIMAPRCFAPRGQRVLSINNNKEGFRPKYTQTPDVILRTFQFPPSIIKRERKNSLNPCGCNGKTFLLVNQNAFFTCLCSGLDNISKEYVDNIFFTHTHTHIPHLRSRETSLQRSKVKLLTTRTSTSVPPN